MTGQERAGSRALSIGPLLTGPILVGVDGSHNASRALGVAARLAVGLGVELRVVHALGLMTTLHGHKVPSHEHRTEIETLLDEQWCVPLTDVEGLGWQTELRDGNPAEVLLHRAVDLEASMIVVGARGISADPNLMLGSTSHHVVYHATCPTVVVPPHS
jgi:nucleotide-binding universal stress UspA family protein